MELMNNDEGVSPVVGVILMVAITVILSAIIATFVLDLGGTVSQNPQAGVSFDQTDNANGNEVGVQVVSMENADSVSAQVSDNAGDGDEQTGSPAEIGGVGSTLTLGDGGTSTSALEAGDKITVTATLEGKTQVIQTYTVK